MIFSGNLIQDLVALMNDRYTGQITIMKDLSGSGIIILMKDGEIYSIRGSEREGIAALTQLIKWKKGRIKLEEVKDLSIFKGKEPMKIEGVFRHLMEQSRLRRDEFMPIFLKTILTYLMQTKGEAIKKEEGKTLRDILKDVESDNANALIIYMANPNMKIFVLMGRNGSVAMGEKEKFSMEDVEKISALYRFSYFIHPVREEGRITLLEGLIEIINTDVFQNDIVPHPPDPRQIKRIIDTNNVVIFYSRSDGGIDVLPCVRGECLGEDFSRFFKSKQEVFYVAW